MSDINRMATIQAILDKKETLDINKANVYSLEELKEEINLQTINKF